jgi:hypothetical protein
MITLAKLRSFRQFGGDFDGWLRMAKRRNKDEMTEQDWVSIAGIIQNLVECFGRKRRGHETVE